MSKEEDLYEDVLPTVKKEENVDQIVPPPDAQQPILQLESVEIPDEATNILYMGEFDWWVTDIEVEQLVSAYGVLEEVKFLEEKSNGKSTGWVMLKFQSVEGAARCKQKLRNVLVNDKPLTILFSRVGYINHTIINNFKFRKKGDLGDSTGMLGNEQDGMMGQRRQYQNFRGRQNFRRYNNYNNRGGGFRRFNNYNNQDRGGFRRYNNNQFQDQQMNQGMQNQFIQPIQQQQQQQMPQPVQTQQQRSFTGNQQQGYGDGVGGGGDGGGGGGGRDFDDQRRSGYKRRRDFDNFGRDYDDRDSKRERR